MKEFKEKTRTTLPLTIETEFHFEDGDTLESVRQQIEVGIFHLQTLFNLAKRSAQVIESDLDDTGGTIAEFLYDVRNTADLGYAVTMSIWRAVSELTELQEEAELNEIEKPVVPLAALISSVLNHPELPDELFDAINEGLDLVADASNFKTLSKIEQSADYLEKVLRDYENAEGESDE